MNLLAVRADRELRRIATWDPGLAAQRLHWCASYRTLHNLGFLHVMGEALMITIVITESGVLFKQGST